MQSTWVDNEHSHSDPFRRGDSASKRTHTNRIQVVSKINMNSERNPVPPPYAPQINVIDQMNQTSVERGVKIPFRRVNTTEGSVEKDQRDRNMLKLMQQQLQLAKKSYQQKIKEQLKQNSIQLSKLKIKIQNNNQLIVAKDQLINQLRSQLRENSPVKENRQPMQQIQQVIPTHIFHKVADLQTKFNMLLDSQNKLGFKMSELSGKVQRVEKGLLSLLACKLANIQAKVNQFTEIGAKRLNNIQLTLQTRLKKQQPNIKGIFPSIHLQQGNQPILLQKLESLRQEVNIFKNKEFRYENSNIQILRNQLLHLQNVVMSFEKRFVMAQSRLKNSRSSKKNNSIDRRQNSSSSCFFQDYQEVYEDVDSLGEDQFFHPLEESTRKFATKDPTNPHTHYRSNTKPTTHNDSFEKFTSDEQEEEGSNEKRLIQTLKFNLYKLPLPIEVDLAGFLHRKSDLHYLVDRNNKKILLTPQELTHCKNKGWITW